MQPVWNKMVVALTKLTDTKNNLMKAIEEVEQQMKSFLVFLTGYSNCKAYARKPFTRAFHCNFDIPMAPVAPTTALRSLSPRSLVCVFGTSLRP